MDTLHSLTYYYRLYRKAFGAYTTEIILISVLAVASSFFEGLGITAIIPIFSFIGGNTGGLPTDTISHFIAGAFALAHVPYTFRMLLLFLAALFVVRTFALFAIQYVTARIVLGYERDTRKKLFSSTLRAGWPYLTQQRIGNLEQLLSTNTTNASQLFGVISTALLIATKAVMYVVVAINVSPWIAGASLVVGALVYIFLRPLFSRNRVLAVAIEERNRELAHFAGEHMIGMKAVKSMSLEKPVIERAADFFERIREINLSIVIFRSIVEMTVRFAGVVFVIGVFIIMYRSPSFSIASFAVIVYAINQIFAQVQIGQVQLHGFLTLTPYLLRITEHVEAARKHAEPDAGAASFSFKRAISFDDVSFSYPERAAAVSGLRFKIKKGELLGITGPSGAGKTTIADLLLRLADPAEGTITIDGVDVRKISHYAWRTRIGYVAQDAVLLNDTIEENIRFYDPSLSHEDIAIAAHLASADFVEEFPQGLQTVIGDRGVFLSGGQRQRIALARVLARRPALLVLDEATSALDAESERAVSEAIEGLHGDITVVVIAHRLATVMRADRIVVIENGSITEEGTPEELRQRNDSYVTRNMKTTYTSGAADL